MVTMQTWYNGLSACVVSQNGPTVSPDYSSYTLTCPPLLPTGASRELRAAQLAELCKNADCLNLFCALYGNVSMTLSALAFRLNDFW